MLHVVCRVRSEEPDLEWQFTGPTGGQSRKMSCTATTYQLSIYSILERRGRERHGHSQNDTASCSGNVHTITHVTKLRLEMKHNMTQHLPSSCALLILHRRLYCHSFDATWTSWSRRKSELGCKRSSEAAPSTPSPRERYRMVFSLD